MFKQEKGITLIALIITIIVLLILAGVSIAMLTGDNGILTRATTTKVENFKAEVKEAIALAVSERTMALQAELATDPTTTGSEIYSVSNFNTTLTKINNSLVTNNQLTCTSATAAETATGALTAATFTAVFEDTTYTFTYSSTTGTVTISANS